MANESLGFSITGTTFLFTPIPATTPPAFTAQITGVDGAGYTAEAVDASYSDIANGLREFLPATKIKPGQITFDINFAPVTEPMTFIGKTGTLLITWSDSGAATWSGSAVLIEYSGGGSMGANTTGKMTFQPSGKFTVTP
jgi:hypothetical protein